MSKSVLLSGYYGFENFGDELILEVILKQLVSSNISPIVLSEEPKQTSQTYGVACVHRTNIPEIWEAMGKTDAFISGGGGLFQDITGPASPLYYGGLIEMASWRRRPVAIFGQGLGPLRSSLSKQITKRALGHASLVLIRDVKSQALAYQLTRKKAKLMADPVWLWEPEESLKSAEKEAIGISLRPWPQLNDSMIKNIAQCLSQTPHVEENGINLIDCQAGGDIVPLAKLEKYLKDRKIACRWFSQKNSILGIAQSTSFIGMRFHSLLIAAQLGVPSVAFSYDPKVQILAAQLKLKDFPVVSLEGITGEDLNEAYTLADTEAIKQNKELALQGFSLLKDWLDF